MHMHACAGGSHRRHRCAVLRPLVRTVPARSRTEFVRHAGLPDERPYVLWAGSALLPGTPPEPGIFLRWASHLRRSNDPRVRDVPILLRPHPSRTAEWAGDDWRSVGNVVMFGGPPVDDAGARGLLRIAVLQRRSRRHHDHAHSSTRRSSGVRSCRSTRMTSFRSTRRRCISSIWSTPSMDCSPWPILWRTTNGNWRASLPGRRRSCCGASAASSMTSYGRAAWTSRQRASSQMRWNDSSRHRA